MKTPYKLILNLQIAALFLVLGILLSPDVDLEKISLIFSEQKIDLADKQLIKEPVSVLSSPQITQEHFFSREDQIVFLKSIYGDFKNLTRYLLKPTSPEVKVEMADLKEDANDEVVPNLEDELLVHKKRMLQGSIYETVRNMDEEKVIAFIKANTKFERKDFDQRFTLAEISQALYDMANNPHEGAWISPLYFGGSVDSKNRVMNGRGEFTSTQQGIYASFEVPGGGVEKVLAKWYRVGDEQPIIYESIEIDQNKEFNFVWASPKEGTWELGDYLVEVYDVKNQFLPISGGKFSIEEVNTDPELIEAQ